MFESGELRGLLEQFLHAGQTDSEGTFTLEPARARAMVANFRLPEPFYYALHMVAAAIAGGATRIELEKTRRGLEFRFDGSPLDDVDLKKLFAGLLGSAQLASRARWRELAVGVFGARALGPRQLEIESGGRLWRLKKEEESIHSSSGSWQNVIRVVTSWGIPTLSLGEPPELAPLRERMRHCGVSLSYRGERLDQKLDFGPGMILGVFRGQGPGTAVAINSARVFAVHEEKSERSYSACCHLGGLGEELLTVAINGVTYTRVWDEHMRAHLALGHLERDFTLSGLVESVELERLQQELVDLKLLLVGQLADSYAQMSPSEQESAETIFLKAAVQVMERGNRELRTRFLEQLPVLTLWNGERIPLGRALEDANNRGYLLYTQRTTPWTHAPLQGELILRLAPAEQSFLRPLVDGLRSGEAILHQAEQAARRREQWQKRSEYPRVLPQGASHAVEWDSGIVGFYPVQPNASVTFLKRGRLLGRLPLDFPPGHVQALVWHPEVEADLTWEGVDPDGITVGRLLGEVNQRLGELLATLGPRWQDLQRDFLVWAARWQLKQGEVARLPLFRHADGSELSLRQIQQFPQPLEACRRTFNTRAVADRKVVLLDRWLAELFTFVTVDAELENLELEWQQRIWWENRYQPGPVELPERSSHKSSFEGGVVGLNQDLKSEAMVGFWREGRPLGAPLRCPVDSLPRGLVAALVDDEFPPGPYWGSVAEGERKQAALQALRERLEVFYLDPQLPAPAVLSYFVHRVRRGLGAPTGALRRRSAFATLGGTALSLQTVAEMPEVLLGVKVRGAESEGVLRSEPAVEEVLKAWLPQVPRRDVSEDLEKRRLLRKPVESRPEPSRFWAYVEESDLFIGIEKEAERPYRRRLDFRYQGRSLQRWNDLWPLPIKGFFEVSKATVEADLYLQKLEELEQKLLPAMVELLPRVEVACILWRALASRPQRYAEIKMFPTAGGELLSWSELEEHAEPLTYLREPQPESGALLAEGESVEVLRQLLGERLRHGWSDPGGQELPAADYLLVREGVGLLPSLGGPSLLLQEDGSLSCDLSPLMVHGRAADLDSLRERAWALVESLPQERERYQVRAFLLRLWTEQELSATLAGQPWIRCGAGWLAPDQLEQLRRQFGGLPYLLEGWEGQVPERALLLHPNEFKALDDFYDMMDLAGELERLQGEPQNWEGRQPGADAEKLTGETQGWIELVPPYEPARLLVVWNRRLVKQCLVPARVPFLAVLHTGLPPQWLFQDQDRLAARAESMALQRLRAFRPEDESQNYFLELLRRLGTQQGELPNALRRTPLFVDHLGRRYSLEGLLEQLETWSVVASDLDPELREQLKTQREPVLVVSYEQRVVLEKYRTLHEISGELLTHTRRRRSLREDWLEKIKVEGDQGSGVIGVLKTPGPACLYLNSELSTQFEDLQVQGELNGPGLDTEFLTSLLGRLCEKLCQRLRGPHFPGFSRLQELLLKFGMTLGSELIEQVPLFVYGDGSSRSLEQLREQEHVWTAPITRARGRAEVLVELSEEVMEALEVWGVSFSSLELDDKDPVAGAGSERLTFAEQVEKYWRRLAPRGPTLRWSGEGKLFVFEVGAVKVDRNHGLFKRLQRRPEGALFLCAILLRERAQLARLNEMAERALAGEE